MGTLFELSLFIFGVGALVSIIALLVILVTAIIKASSDNPEMKVRGWKTLLIGLVCMMIGFGICFGSLQ